MEAYQTGEEARLHPRVRLTALPSPLQRAERLEAALREGGSRPPRLYIKRDDLLSLAFGGNKIRNLEFALGAAIAAGATDVITGGRLQSNHCRLTAAACARLGLRAHLVLSGTEPAVSTGNLLLCRLLGAAITCTDSDNRALRDAAMREIAGRAARDGGRPYVVPVGGSDVAGAYGHLLAAHELLAQADALGERVAAVVLATATGGTQAGMLAGLRQAGSGAASGVARLDAFAVAKSAAELGPEVLRIANELAAAEGIESISASDVLIDDSMIGEGYGIPTAAGDAALALLGATEGIVADPVYTGKALAGLLAAIRRGGYGEDETVVWVHTGGAPALFASLLAGTPV